MSFIFPECPHCAEKASKGHGVDLSELPHFTYVCDDCGAASRGYFFNYKVDWQETKPPGTIAGRRGLLGLVARKVRKVLY